MYLLLDANVTAGYYLPRSLDSKRARKRIEILLQSVLSGESNHFLYIPNICIAEVFSVFMKHAYGSWNPHIRKKGTIDKRVYDSLVCQFQKDIHNGKFMYHLELNRYHILGINLVAPIDHYFQISRRKGNIRPMGTFDHLIISMGIHLAHIHGRGNVCIVSSDDRITDILTKCKGEIPARTVTKLKLNIAKQVTGKPFGCDLFPLHVNLKKDSDEALKRVFSEWPLPIGKVPRHYRWTRA